MKYGEGPGESVVPWARTSLLSSIGTYATELHGWLKWSVLTKLQLVNQFIWLKVAIFRLNHVNGSQLEK